MLVAHDLRIGFAERPLISDLSFELEPGQTYGLMGPSGSGKTSLLRALAWLLPLQSGRITLQGRTPAEMGIAAWRREVLYVPQQPPPLPSSMDAFSTKVFALRATREKGESDLAARAKSWTQHFRLRSEAWHETFATLSGGEQQRSFLAVALALRPRVLLLDEPTSALDPMHRQLVEAAVRGKTSIWVSHDAAQIERVSDRIVELAHG